MNNKFDERTKGNGFTKRLRDGLRRMKLCLLILVATVVAVGLHRINGAGSKAYSPPPGYGSAAKTASTQPAAAELSFHQFFVTPIGPQGLIMTETLRALDGKRIRISGYVVRQEKPIPGLFLLAPIRVHLHENHYGLADDLPASTVYVFCPKGDERVIASTGGPVSVTGRLGIGNREEADGRISTVRLAMDSPPAPGPLTKHFREQL